MKSWIYLFSIIMALGTGVTDTKDVFCCDIEGCTQTEEHYHSVCNIADCTEIAAHMHDGVFVILIMIMMAMHIIIAA